MTIIRIVLVKVVVMMTAMHYTPLPPMRDKMIPILVGPTVEILHLLHAAMSAASNLCRAVAISPCWIPTGMTADRLALVPVRKGFTAVSTRLH